MWWGVLVVGVCVVIGLGGGGAAFAYFSGAGSGSGSGSLATAATVTLAPGTGSSDLLPGRTGAVVTVASNSGNATAHIVSLALDTTRGTSGFAVDSSHSTCATSVLSFTTQTNGGSGWNVTGGANLTITMTGALAMTTAAVATCQGATFTVYLTASQ